MKKMTNDVSRIDLANPIRIAVLGMGHIGLPTSLGLAELGWEVVSADSDSAKVAMIKAGQSPFYEPGLQELLTKHHKMGAFRPTDDVEEAIRSASVLFLCVGTPQRDNGQPDLSQIEVLARTIARNLNGYKLIVEKSTVPAVTALWIKKTIQRYARAGSAVRVDDPEDPPSSTPHRYDADPIPSFDVASNPEFLQEGKALQNIFHPDRIVCGVESERARRILERIYQPLRCPLLVTDLNTAELIKHAANAFLCTKISFINMVADLCEAVGANITKVSEAIGLDPRIAPDFLQAGIGFGGYCFPKDLRAFIYLAEENSVDASFLKEVERVNLRRVDLFLKKVHQALWVVRGKTLAILGLAFKPGTDDIREAPSLRIIESLLKEGATLRLYDPQAMPSTLRKLPEEPGRLIYAASAYEAARGADALLILTEWHEFQELDLCRLRELMAVPIVVDGRNVYNPRQMREAGFEYLCVGRMKAEALSPQPLELKLSRR